MKAAARAVVGEMRGVADAARLPGMARVGISVDRAIGVSIPNLRRIARGHRGDHALALELWTTGIHEARILASMVDDPALVTRRQMDAWVVDLDSWDVCDQVCGNLFRSARAVDAAARAWAGRREAFVRRAAFSVAATQAVHDRGRPDADFEAWFPRIYRAAVDGRDPVKKGVSWALRQIGKRNDRLRRLASPRPSLLDLDDRHARWIARDALRELRSDAVVRRTAVTR